jgi:hypothetical protein
MIEISKMLPTKTHAHSRTSCSLLLLLLLPFLFARSSTIAEKIKI